MSALAVLVCTERIARNMSMVIPVPASLATLALTVRQVSYKIISF